ncbi:MAG: hypothetical protein P4L16_04610 [Chlamydiales bacterium]|nr:hypothetical protein [Chlamydiales bacterium]
MRIRSTAILFFMLISFFCYSQVIPGESTPVLTSTDIDQSISHFVTSNQPIELMNYINSLAPLSYDTPSFVNYSEAIQYLITSYPNFIQSNPMLLKPLARALYTVGVNGSFYAGNGTYDSQNIHALQNIANGLTSTDSETLSIKWSVNHYVRLLTNLFTYSQSPIIAASNPSATNQPLPSAQNPTSFKPQNPVSGQPASWGFIPPAPPSCCRPHCR